MKKFIFVLFLSLFLGVSTYSQPRPPHEGPTLENNGLSTQQPAQSPLNPSSLLLLGLAASTVGFKLFRSSKKQ